MSNSTPRSTSKTKSTGTHAGKPGTRPEIQGDTLRVVKVMFADGQSVWGRLMDYTETGVVVDLTGIVCRFDHVSLVEVQDTDQNFNYHLTAPKVTTESLGSRAAAPDIGLLCPHSFSDYVARNYA